MVPLPCSPSPCLARTLDPSLPLITPQDGTLDFHEVTNLAKRFFDGREPKPAQVMTLCLPQCTAALCLTQYTAACL